MDPFTITAACTGLIAGIAQLSVQISSFVGDVRDARKDMDAVSRELGSLSLCLHALGDDSENPALPDGLTESLKAILRNCDLVVTQMKALLKKMGSGHLARRIQWSTFGKDEMNKLRSSLESHKSAFTIAVDISSIHLMAGVKGTVGDIKTDTTAIKQDTEHLLEEISNLREQVNALQGRDGVGVPMLERFLAESIVYADSVAEPAEWDSLSADSNRVEKPTPEDANDRLQAQSVNDILEAHAAKNPIRRLVGKDAHIVAFMSFPSSSKSAFLRELAAVKILTLGTGILTMYKCTCSEVPEFYLVEFPIFGNYRDLDVESLKEMAEFLKEMACFLSTMYLLQLQLVGVVWLVTKQAKTPSLFPTTLAEGASDEMLDELCGPDLPKWTIRQTLGGDMDECTSERETGNRIQPPDRVGPTVNAAARTPAEVILDLVSGRQGGTLRIQEEMVEKGLTLQETASGSLFTGLLTSVVEGRMQEEAEVHTLQQQVSSLRLAEDEKRELSEEYEGRLELISKRLFCIREARHELDVDLAGLLARFRFRPVGSMDDGEPLTGRE